MILHHTSGHRSRPNISPIADHNRQLFFFFSFITAHNQQLQPHTMNSSLLDDFNNYIRLDLNWCNCPMALWEPYSVLMLTYCVVLMFPTKKVTKKITGRNSWLLFSRVWHTADLMLPAWWFTSPVASLPQFIQDRKRPPRKSAQKSNATSATKTLKI